MESVNRKLTDKQVKEIKQLIHQGKTGKEIAALMGVSRTTISLIKNGARYSRLTA